MDRDCAFCALVAGENPHQIVHETDAAVAFLDANPLAPGHTLVIPRAHHRRLADLPEPLVASLFGTLHTVAPAVEGAVGADALTVRVNDGEAAGQTVGHVHAHVVPRFEDEDDAGVSDLPPVEDRPPVTADRAEVAAAVRDRFGG